MESNVADVLSDDGKLIRDVVRFDARQSNFPEVCSMLENLEQFCSRRIVEPSLSLMEYFNVLAGNEIMASESVARRPRRRVARESLSLSLLLAGAHVRVFSDLSTASDAGHRARQMLKLAIHEQGLTTNSVVPLSLNLLARKKAYESVWDDETKLAQLLHQALRDALVRGDAIGEEVRRTANEWKELVTPKPGTVLHVLLTEVLGSVRVTGAEALRLTGANKSNVYRAIDVLEEHGILFETTGRKKDQVWLATTYVDRLARIALVSRR
jgi:hypothetical protein